MKIIKQKNIIFFAFVAVIIGFSIYLYNLFFLPLTVNETIFEVEKGDSALTIAKKLHQHNLIKNKNAFYYYVRLSGQQGDLSYGKYLFKEDINMLEVLKKIREGRVLLQKVTIPEGLPAWRICRLLSERGFGNYQRYVSLYTDSLFAKKVTGFNIPSLEGFLYPETYHLPDEASEEFILTLLVKEFFNQTAELDFKPNELLDFYDTIILASIVEMEARLSAEKPLIASVYLNRLKYSYKLQADPTVAYILELQGKRRSKIYYKDLLIDSPYNTYKYSGLPPTPICSPSHSSIDAVLNPAESDYFFFFADGSGGHTFTRTYEQHLFEQNQLKRNNGK
jgi:UPF0755 protein